jgi:hypothetical protein
MRARGGEHEIRAIKSSTLTTKEESDPIKTLNERRDL